MKICVYQEFSKTMRGSGIEKSFKHFKKILKLAKIPYTKDTNAKYDILHVQSFFLSTLWKIKRAKRKGKKIVISSHLTAEDFKESYKFSNYLAPLLKKYLKYFYNHADLIVSPSEYTRQLMINEYEVSQKKVKVLSNGIDTRFWKPTKTKTPDVLSEEEEFLKEYNLEKPIIFAVGFIFKRKGVIDFVKVAEKFPKIRFLWIGKKIEAIISEDDELKKALHNPPKNVKFIGYINNIRAGYAAGDIFFFPTHEENQGIVVLEAAAMGKPIIVRDIPVFRSYLTENKNCLMAKNNKEFEKKIRLLLKNKELQKELSKESIKLAKKHSFEEVGKTLKKYYKELLGIK